MAAGEKEDPFALAALAEVNGAGTLVIRSGLRSNLDAKSGSEGATDVCGGVYGGDVVEKLRAGRTGVDGLPEGDLDVREASLGEYLLAVFGRNLGILKGQRLRFDANP